MGWKRVVPFALLGACLILVTYIVVDPTSVVGQSNCDCSWPTEEYTASAGKYSLQTTETLFAQNLGISDVGFTDYDNREVWEYPPPGYQNTDSCYEQNPNNPFGYGPSVLSPEPGSGDGASYWVVGVVGYTNYSVQTVENAWGYDIVGYFSNYTTWYKNNVSLPCGSTVYQGMEITCANGENDISYTSYMALGSNSLSSTIEPTYNTNCREEATGDSEACENESN